MPYLIPFHCSRARDGFAVTWWEEEAAGYRLLTTATWGRRSIPALPGCDDGYVEGGGDASSAGVDDGYALLGGGAARLVRAVTTATWREGRGRGYAPPPVHSGVHAP